MDVRTVLPAIALGWFILSAGLLGGERGHAADAGAVIDAADERGLAMVFTGVRVFRH